MTGFQHDIAGGQGNLVATAVQSPNYSAGSAGWQIRKDGSAEFNNLTIRGTFSGTDFIISSAGIFMYSGAPASGNLMISLAQAAGTDSFGNPYVKGLSFGLVTDSAQVQLTPSTGGQAAKITFPVNGVSLSNTPNMAAGIVSGSPNYSDMVLSGPALATVGQRDWVQVGMFSNSNSGDAQGNLRYISDAGAVTVQLLWDASGVLVNTALTVNGPFSSDSGAISSDGAGGLAVQSLTVNGSSSTGSHGLTDGTINGSSGGQVGGAAAHTHGPGSYAVTNGQHTHPL